MRLLLKRFSHGADDTLGVLYINNSPTACCFVLEDEHREKKKHSETRIPDGEYVIKLRNTDSSMAKRYNDRFFKIDHQGMLELQDVPGFSRIYIHIGNTDDDTSGCLLVGEGLYENHYRNGTLLRSTVAYERLYPLVLKDMQRSEIVSIKIVSI